MRRPDERVDTRCLHIRDRGLRSGTNRDEGELRLSIRLPDGVEFTMSIYRSVLSKPRTLIAGLAVIALVPALGGGEVAASDTPTDEAALQATRVTANQRIEQRV